MGNRYKIWNDVKSRRRMLQVAQQVLDSPVLAEEVVQEAYLRLLENEFESESGSESGYVESPSAWLIKVTRNLAIDQARRRLREHQLLQLVPGLDRFEHHNGRHAMESRLAEMISCLLHVSGSHDTAIVLLHVVFGMSYQDIATICRRSPTACRQTGSRALRKCFKALDADESYDETSDTDMYVQAILDASTAPLIDCLSVTSPVSLLSVAASQPNSYGDSLPINAGRAKQVLVFTPTGVRWALVLDGMLLCLLDSFVHNSSVKVT